MDNRIAEGLLNQLEKIVNDIVDLQDAGKAIPKYCTTCGVKISRQILNAQDIDCSIRRKALRFYDEFFSAAELELIDKSTKIW